MAFELNCLTFKKKSPTVQEEDCGATGFYGFCFLEGNMKNHAL